MVTASPGTPTYQPLRGRTGPSRILRSALDTAMSGNGGALIAAGPPGSGRTRMLDQMREAATGMVVLRADGIAAEADLPYAALQRALNPVRSRTERLPERQASALRQVIDGIAPTDASPLAPALALVAMLTAAPERPVLLIADDLHLVDHQSRAVIAAVGRRIADAPVLLLGSAPDPAADPLIADLPALLLRPLPQHDMEAIASDTAPGMAERVRGRVVHAAHGSPAALLDFLDALDGDQRSGSAALPEPLPLGRRMLRSHRTLAASLPEATRDLLLLASAAPDADVDTLLRAAGPGLSAADVEAAEDAGAVRSGPEGLRFTDPLLRTAVYQSAPLSARRDAHTALASAHPPRSAPGRHAEHRYRAALGRDEKTAEELADLADAARALEGHASAADVLECAGRLSPAPERRAALLAEAAGDAWTAGLAERSTALLESTGSAGASGASAALADHVRGVRAAHDGNAFDAADILLSASDRLAAGDPARAVEALMDAADAASYAGDPFRHDAAARRAAALAEGDRPPGARFALAFLEGCSASFGGRYAEASEHLRTASDIARRLDDPRMLIHASIAALRLGDTRMVRDLASRAAETARRKGARALVPQALQMLMYAEFWTARLPSAIGSAMDGLTISRETGQPNCAAHLLASLSLLAALQGDADTCRARAAAVRDIAHRNGLGLPTGLTEWALALLDMAHGDAVTAFNRLRVLARADPGRGHPTMRVLTAPLFIEAAVRNGDLDRAEAALRGYGRWAEGTGSISGRALAARGRALVARAKDEPDYADHFEEALALHRACADDEVERARTALLYGSALRRARTPAEARGHLQDALGTFDRIGARLWADQARTELRAIGAPAARPDTSALPQLTEQQRRIAALVKEGATNREIAAHLFLSPRTVEYHLRAIFRKLGIRSRVDLARMTR